MTTTRLLCSQDYLHMSLQEGVMVAVSNIGAVTRQVKVAPLEPNANNAYTYNDNKWHTVTMHRRLATVRLWRFYALFLFNNSFFALYFFVFFSVETRCRGKNGLLMRVCLPLMLDKNLVDAFPSTAWLLKCLENSAWIVEESLSGIKMSLSVVVECRQNEQCREADGKR